MKLLLVLCVLINFSARSFGQTSAPTSSAGGNTADGKPSGFNQGYSYNTGIRPYNTGYSFYRPFGDQANQANTANSAGNNKNHNNNGVVTSSQIPTNTNGFSGYSAPQQTQSQGGTNNFSPPNTYVQTFTNVPQNAPVFQTNVPIAGSGGVAPSVNGNGQAPPIPPPQFNEADFGIPAGAVDLGNPNAFGLNSGGNNNGGSNGGLSEFGFSQPNNNNQGLGQFGFPQSNNNNNGFGFPTGNSGGNAFGFPTSNSNSQLPGALANFGGGGGGGNAGDSLGDFPGFAGSEGLGLGGGNGGSNDGFGLGGGNNNNDNGFGLGGGNNNNDNGFGGLGDFGQSSQNRETSIPNVDLPDGFFRRR